MGCSPHTLALKMTKKKAAYQRFLRSRFWRSLSLQTRVNIGRCQLCGSENNLQCHHIRYPKRWTDTQPSDLQVLCSRCHCLTHGKEMAGRRRRVKNFIFPYRDDHKFNTYVHRCHCLIKLIFSGRKLRERDRRFLAHAQREYPATPTNRSMIFQTNQVLKFSELVWTDIPQSGAK